jgi:chaperonin GroES
VVAAGPGRVSLETGAKMTMSVQTGDGVIYGQYDGNELRVNDVDHQMIKDEDVLLKFTGTDPKFDNVQCVKDHILVKLAPREDKTATGLIIVTSEDKEKRSQYGTVAMVGPGRQASSGPVIPLPVKVGDGVRFRESAGSDIKLDGVEYRVVRATEIICKWAP